MSKRVNELFLILHLVFLTFGNFKPIEADGGRVQVGPQIDINSIARNRNAGARVKVIAGSRENRGANDERGSDKGDIASKAAQEAKAASDAQNIAGKQASHQVKVQLAEKAFRASKAAEAVLIGKIALVEQLGEETKETQSVVREGSLSFQRAKENVAAATKAAKEAHHQIDTLRRAVETAKSNLSNARTAAEGARRSLGEKEQLLVAAKKRVEELKGRLQKSKGDLARTNQAAVKAEASAREARVKVNHDTPAAKT
ncbi:uncharacterized protein LOC107043741 [Diachasma alloeum]|uniref:uncharacterized protein LOC107043741 n=1 Tax=Diachasma alloeum TaxID=454923 RepID=UPI0007382F76|nr:uncharacterized protein LOC107043741 [Diachasma alloeum]